MVHFLRNHTDRYKRIWLDIEEYNDTYNMYWFTNEEDNQQFFEKLLKASKKHKKTGVYTKQTHWEFIMGNTYNGGSEQPLWIAK